ncbi:AsmA family protein [Plebeiibacterium sediminum]|uniref:AsmA family protein n=1 Tax=Plebeiibacterium sediminum TaxID=2992112 RepID=A0AAE3SH07_9BACT|nr:AsmA family protein [Plebeiobacterium sediminum]MCW3788851.1 AsmA family protein [Plebeiobacterium sediminum]
MKKFIKVFAIIIGVFVLLLFITPILLKGKIETLAKEEINKQINATVNWDDFSLSLIRKFPSLSVNMSGLSVIGSQQFEGDTLLSLKDFYVSVDLLSALSGNRLDVETILLDQPFIYAKVLADSTANWDIMKSSTTEVEEEDSEESSSSFGITLEEFEIKDATLKYDDATMALTTSVNHFNLNLSGDLSASSTDLKVNSSIESINLTMEEVRYLNNLSVSLSANMLADMDQMLFTFKENDLMLNRLNLGFDGTIALLDEGYDLDLNLKTKRTDFDAIFGLIPEAFMSYVEGVNTKGNLTLQSTLKGVYVDADHLPAFNVKLIVEDGFVQYPDLPKSIEDINVNFTVDNSGGSADNTISEIKKFHFKLGDNPFDASMIVKNPVSNAQFKGGILGTIDLGSLKDAIPLDSFDIKGIIDANITVDGDLKTIEAEDYEAIKANGNVGLNHFYYASNDLPQAVDIPSAQLKFSPKEITLDEFACNIGKSDFSLKGKIENYLPYIFKDETIKGSLIHQSKMIDVNEFLMEESEEEATEVEDTTALETIEVPKNIDFVFTSSIDKILYDKLVINDAKGKITVRNGIVSLDGMDMNLLDGKIIMGGAYNTQNIDKPFADFTFNASNIDLTKTANSFSVIDSLMPIAKSSKGKISATLHYNSLLDKEMSPVISSITGGGNLKSPFIEVSNSKVLNGMAQLLKNDKYKKLKAENIDVNFILQDGKIIVKPFSPTVFDKKLTISGEQGFDQSLNYVVKAPVSRKDVAGALGFLSDGFADSGSDYMVDVIIKGTAKDPKMSLDLSEATKQAQKEVGKEAEKVIKEVLKDENVQKSVNEFLKGFGKKKK